MRLNVADPEAARSAAEWLRETVGAEWVSEQLAERERARDQISGGIERLLRTPTYPPVVEWLARVDDWIDRLRSGQPPDETFVRFRYAVRVLRTAQRLEGGDAYLADLVENRIRVRPEKSAAPREFWDQFFEAEAAVRWSEAGGRVALGPPGGNPDLEVEIAHDPRTGRGLAVPVECWRSGKRFNHTDKLSEVWRQIQSKLTKGVRHRGQLLKVNIRAHRRPQMEDIDPLVERVWELADAAPAPDAPPHPGPWITESALSEAYQVCVGIVGETGLRIERDSLDNDFFDIAAEPGLSVLTKAMRESEDRHVYIDPCVFGFREDRNPRWIVEHVIDGFETKSRQLVEQNEGVVLGADGTREVLGGIALRIPNVRRGTLLQIDDAIREKVERAEHVALVALFWEEPHQNRSFLGMRGDEPVFEVEKGLQFQQYVIVGESNRLPLGLTDSRAAVFGEAPATGVVVDPETGEMTDAQAADTAATDPQELTASEWPPSENQADLEQLDGRSDSFGMIIPEPEGLWEESGDLLLKQISFGKNDLRIVRDRHLNLRALRIGDGRFRDMVALDIRPFRGADKLLILVAWDENEWRCVVGTPKEGKEVAGTAPRGRYD